MFDPKAIDYLRKTMPPSAPSPKKILVVDDDSDIRCLLQMTLRDAGYEVVVASDGLEGLQELADEGPIDLILLDLMMPVMNGWQFLEALNSREAAPPVVVFTAVDQGVRPPGSHEMLVKPTPNHVLLSRLQSYLA